MNEIFLYLGLYVALILLISWYANRSNSTEDFLIAGRNRNFIQLFTSKLAALIGTGFFLLYTGFTYQYGWAMIIAFVCFVFSYLVYAYWAVPKIYAASREQKMYTMGDFVSYKLNNISVGKHVDTVVALFSFAWILGTFIGGVIIVQSLLGIPYTFAVLINTVVVGVYLFSSGYRAVLLTDMVQIISIAFLYIVVLYSVFHTVDLSSIARTSVEPVPVPLIAGMIVFGFFQIFAGADRFQLIYSAKNAKTASQAMFWVVVPYMAMFIPLIIVGLYMRTVAPGANPNDIFLTFLTQYAPASVLPLAGVMLVAGLMSSIDTWVYAIASVGQSFLQKFSTNRTLRVRYAIVLTLSCLGGMSLVFRDLIEVAIVSVSLIMVIPPVTLYVLCGGKHSIKLYSALICGTLAIVPGIIFLGIVPELTVVALVGVL